MKFAVVKTSEPLEDCPPRTIPLEDTIKTASLESPSPDTQDDEAANSSLPEATGIETDSLSSGVVFMMGLAIAQRGVGFLRTTVFCRLLGEQELGQWSLVFSFVMLSAPMTLMGITGSFGRYVEHYLQRGQARSFFRHTGTAVLSLTASVLIGIWICRDYVSWLLFGSTDQSTLLVPAMATLTTTILYNYLLEVVIALRRIKVGSTMELISSWSFATVSIGLLTFTELGSYGVILGFALGNLLGAAYAATIVFGLWEKLPANGETLTPSRLWKKVAPFAIGLWLVNMVTNLFDMVDRYMIVHFSGIPAAEAQGMVGQYFSSLAVPLLLVGVSVTLSHLVMPYLSEDWEAGNFQAVSDRVNFSMKLIGTMLAIGSTSIIIVAPLLFGVVFGGKYDAGRAVLPWTVSYCFWMATSQSAYNYLYCVERTKLMCTSLLAGLITNVALNALLLPHFGLHGAALATATGCLVNLSLVLFFSVQLGLQLNRGTFFVLLFPLVFGLGATATAITLIALLYICCRTTWFLTAEEREQLEAILFERLQKVIPQRFLLANA